MELENINPSVYKKTTDREITELELDENRVDPIDSREVFGKYAKMTFNFFLLILMLK